MIRHARLPLEECCRLVLRGRVGGTGGLIGVDARRRRRAAVHDAGDGARDAARRRGAARRDRARRAGVSAAAAARGRRRRGASSRAFLAFWVFDVARRGRRPVARRPVRAARRRPRTSSSPALLGLALVPGPLLAGTSGLLFGAAVGTVVTLASARPERGARRCCSRGASPARRRERLDGLAALAERHGFVAVVVQRLAPGVPDAPATYVFGSLGVRVWQIALGTLVGSAPRSFSYTSIGASLDDPDSPLAIAGVVGLVVTAIVGAELARRVVTRR